MNIDLLVLEAADLLQQLINTPSFSREEDNAAQVLVRFLEINGLESYRQDNNVWCMAPGFSDKKPTLLLNAHIDTVKPVAGWKRNPLQATLENGRIYGLGSNDDGGSVVCLLQAFRELSKKEQRYNLIFLASSEEEVSGKNGIESILPLLPPISVALVGEPTDMHPAVAEKGLMVVDVTSNGTAGHAARNEGDNAIYRALKDIEWFRTYKFAKESALLGGVKMSVTIINGGTQHNVIPDKCQFTADIRSNEHYSNKEIYDIVCQNINSEAKARSFRLNSSCINTKHPLVTRAIQLGRTPFGSPTLSDQALMNFPSLKMGPGQSCRSHTADEFIEVQELHQGIEIYLQLLDGLEL